MRDRAELLVGRRVRAMWVMTFHAACARMLRAHADRLGYTRQFTIYDQADSRRLIKRCLDELGIDPKRFTPGAIHAQISDAKNRLRDADAYGQMVGSFFEQTVADVYRAYERELHRMNAMDFDDLLVRAVNVLELFQEVRERYADRLPARAGRRVPGHQPRPVPVAPAAGGRAAEPDGRRGRRSVDLRLPRRRHPQHPRVRGHVPGRPRGQARAELPLDADDPRRGQRGDRATTAAQKPKSLWTELGQGDPIKVRELEDEHAEARFVDRRDPAAASTRGSRGPRSPSSTGPTRSRACSRTRSCGPRSPYQVIGGTKFYERAEIKDAIAYLTALVNPQDAGAFTRIVNSPSARDRRYLGVARAGVRQHDRRLGLGRGVRARAGARARARRRSRRCGGSWARCTCCASAPSRARRSPSCSRRCCSETGYLEALEAERTIEAQGRIENLEELVNVAAEYDARRAGRASASLADFLQQVALRLGRRRPHRRRGPGHADDAAQRQGPRVPDRVHDRLRGGGVPALARARRGRARGGAAALLRRASPAPSATCI